jgi:hypothetical protein
VAGGMAARDINTTNNTTIINPSELKSETALSRLYRDLQAKAEGDEVLTDYISQLKIFTRVVQNEIVVGVDGKLTAAGRTDEVDMAMAMKEMVYGQLRENIFSRVFQLIYAVTGAKPRASMDYLLAPTRASRIQAMCEPTRRPR